MRAKVDLPGIGAPGGAEGTRTPDPLLAKQVLSQLSYGPTRKRSGLERWSKYRGGCRAASRADG